ncbi:hypothetical protein [Vibrio breoganii]|uniref:Solute-binding protein family 5 domain-containing protein n=1 Tax=Vibrio breoganii TaxID=553239 RepID=A0ABX1U6M4_9VIBR|nr:hypothetical protein [Vibrio breoganii]NMO73484.1 hypothetical protein [Vibrio breoganii]NMR70107.1 hypothetical protein [Vibrio breoganii]PML89208.1 hypothetical protein BCT67_08570 [Vibrio breoganii]
MWVNNFLVGDDPFLDHYYWLLLCESATNLLTPFKQQQWLTEARHADDLKETLSQIEHRYLTQHRVIPLWKKSIAFQSHQTLRGTNINSLGFMNIAKIWFDKRES